LFVVCFIKTETQNNNINIIILLRKDVNKYYLFRRIRNNKHNKQHIKKPKPNRKQKTHTHNETNLKSKQKEIDCYFVLKNTKT